MARKRKKRKVIGFNKGVRGAARRGPNPLVRYLALDRPESVEGALATSSAPSWANWSQRSLNSSDDPSELTVMMGVVLSHSCSRHSRAVSRQLQQCHHEFSNHRHIFFRDTFVSINANKAKLAQKCD